MVGGVGLWALEPFWLWALEPFWLWALEPFWSWALEPFWLYFPAPLFGWDKLVDPFILLAISFPELSNTLLVR